MALFSKFRPGVFVHRPLGIGSRAPGTRNMAKAMAGGIRSLLGIVGIGLAAGQMLANPIIS